MYYERLDYEDALIFSQFWVGYGYHLEIIHRFLTNGDGNGFMLFKNLQNDILFNVSMSSENRDMRIYRFLSCIMAAILYFLSCSEYIWFKAPKWFIICSRAYLKLKYTHRLSICAKVDLYILFRYIWGFIKKL